MKKRVLIWGALLCFFLKVGYAQGPELREVISASPETAALTKFIDTPEFHFIRFKPDQDLAFQFI